MQARNNQCLFVSLLIQIQTSLMKRIFPAATLAASSERTEQFFFPQQQKSHALQTCTMSVGRQLTIRAKREPVLGVDIAYLSVLLSG